MVFEKFLVLDKEPNEAGLAMFILKGEPTKP
jgi:hypothetical protein